MCSYCINSAYVKIILSVCILVQAKYLCVLLAVRARCNTISWQTCQPPKMDRHPRFSAKHKGGAERNTCGSFASRNKVWSIVRPTPHHFPKVNFISQKFCFGTYIYETYDRIQTHFQYVFHISRPVYQSQLLLWHRSY